MRSAITHLLDADGNRLCNQGGPVVSAPAILEGTGDGDLPVVFCSICARAVLAPIVQLIHTRCGVDRLPNEQKSSDAHQLLQAILSLTTTSPDEEAAVMRIMGTSLVELDGYIDDAEGDHA